MWYIRVRTVCITCRDMSNVYMYVLQKHYYIARIAKSKVHRTKIKKQVNLFTNGTQHTHTHPQSLFLLFFIVIVHIEVGKITVAPVRRQSQSKQRHLVLEQLQQLGLLW